MSMLEITFITTANHIEDLCHTLDEFDVAAITRKDAGNQPIYEPKPGEIIHWKTIQVTVLCESDVIAPIETYLAQQQEAGTIASLAQSPLPDKDWVTLTQQQTKPITIGKLHITPNWLPIDENKINVIFNPGHAFGTGSHPTTYLCLAWLEAHIQGGETILDFGCGSSILAISALKLGASHAFAVDYDPQALSASQTNAELNTISPKSLTIVSSNALDIPPTDIVLANIISATLIDLSDTLISHVNPNGKLVLSGILENQVDETINAFAKQLTLIQVHKKEEWALLEFSN